MNCPFCTPDNTFKEFEINRFNHWRLELHSNQCYLGRCLLILNRHTEDLFDITLGEREELFQIMPKVKDSLSRSFTPTMFNYTSLGNEIPHLHIHIIPRHNSKKEFAGTTFEDKNWGHNPSPYDKSFKVPQSTYAKIVNTLKSNLS